MNYRILGNETEAARALAEKAEARLLESLGKARAIECDSIGFAVMREGGTAAAVWSDFRLEESALKYLEENGSALGEGETYVSTVSLGKYLRERGDRILSEKWRALEGYIGKPITDELKELYKLYTDEIVVWMAKLYDPKIGGWYWSNSARDTEGFLPSIEETYEAMMFIKSSGMAGMFDNDWSRAIPDWLKKKIGDFVYNLQDEDGFFYHPQWPKEYIIENNRQSRITRDVGSAKTLLRGLGIKPKYPDPGKRSEEKRGEKEKPAMLTQYESAENFAAYIKGFDDEISAIEDPYKRAFKFYYYGNLFQSTTGYVNKNPEFKKILLDFFKKWQNPKNGLWSDVLCYDATNGLHKIASVYNSIGARLEHVDEMVASTMEMISVDPKTKPAGAGTYVYNAWSCFPYIYYNIRHFAEGSEAEREAACQKIKDTVLRTAPKTISYSREHIKGLRREDGSFSYSRSGSCPTAQGCPIAVPGACEGDMNGNSIATLALIQHIMRALEAEEYEIPLFTEAERVKFMDILEELNAQTK